MKNVLLLFYMVCWVGICNAQYEETDSISKSEMTKLSFMAGNWQGSGWMMGMDRTKSLFDQTEKIQFKLDSTLMLIEGKGMANGKTIHDALATVTYNKEKNCYDFRSYLNTGRKGVFKAEIKNNKFYWYPNENTRYIIWLNEEEQWFEKGEFRREGNWYQFFEMILDRVDE